jgi:hypothetical protein
MKLEKMEGKKYGSEYCYFFNEDGQWIGYFKAVFSRSYYVKDTRCGYYFHNSLYKSYYI